MDNKKIYSIIVDQVGWICSHEEASAGIMASKLEWFDVGGEMGYVKWIRQTFVNGAIKEYNGKYVIEVQYEKGM
jgi:hypothetical protein